MGFHKIIWEIYTFFIFKTNEIGIFLYLDGHDRVIFERSLEKTEFLDK